MNNYLLNGMILELGLENNVKMGVKLSRVSKQARSS